MRESNLRIIVEIENNESVLRAELSDKSICLALIEALIHQISHSTYGYGVADGSVGAFSAGLDTIARSVGVGFTARINLPNMPKGSGGTQ